MEPQDLEMPDLTEYTPEVISLTETLLWREFLNRNKHDPWGTRHDTTRHDPTQTSLIFSPPLRSGQTQTSTQLSLAFSLPLISGQTQTSLIFSPPLIRAKPKPPSNLDPNLNHFLSGANIGPQTSLIFSLALTSGHKLPSNLDPNLPHFLSSANIGPF